MIAVYRVGIFVTTPGVNRTAMRQIVQQSGGFLGMFNLFSGGALEQLSIFAFGIMPYVSASIILLAHERGAQAPRGAPQGRRGGSAQDQPVHPLRHHRPQLLVQAFGIALYLESLNDSTVR
jgi:preprotein translocase subunit SecY